MSEPWWLTFPGRLEFELEALRKVCSEVDILKQDEKSGQLGMRVVLELAGEKFTLRAEFPAFYPYTRPIVYAEGSSFKWHQNPYAKNLCLLGRTAENWVPTQTLAGHLTEQMPKLVSAVTADSPASAADFEELQAEPITAFLTYQEESSLLLLAERAGTTRSKGTFAAVCAPSGAALRGAVVRVDDDERKALLNISETRANAMGFTKHIQGRWYRLTERPRTGRATDFLLQIAERYPEAGRREWTIRGGNYFELIGVLLPEESGWRELGESMLFVIVHRHKPQRGREIITADFVRSFQADSGTLAARIPELGGIRDKLVLLTGTGSIGAPCVLELARSGLGALNLADGDVVEGGNSVRWPLGLAFSGLRKVTALHKYIEMNHPFTRVQSLPLDIGSEAYTLETDEQLWHGVNLVLDATAERGISFLLSERARMLGIPYVYIASTQGNWGGTIVALHPERTPACWWCLSKHWEEGSLPLPAVGPQTSVQVTGCASPTFTGAFVDSSEISLMGVRVALSFLTTSYPKYTWDYAAVSLRDMNGNNVVPNWQTASLPRHPGCQNHL